MSFLLYHYASASKGLFQSLQTERHRLKNVKDDFPSYLDHVSFMFERPPFEKIAKLYKRKGHTHPFWYAGHELNEYIVDLDQFKTTKEIFYKIVESPEQTKLYYNDSVSDSAYRRELNKIIEQYGYEGNNVRDLKKAWLNLKSRMSKNWMLEHYASLMNTSNFDDNKNKYAPTVPHLMFYTADGVIHYHETNKINIGGRSSLESKPIFIRW